MEGHTPLTPIISSRLTGTIEISNKISIGEGLLPNHWGVPLSRKEKRLLAKSEKSDTIDELHEDCVGLYAPGNDN